MGMDAYSQMMQNRANNYYNSLAQGMQNNVGNNSPMGYPMQQTQPANPPIIYGKIVQNENDVSPNDVPLDGKIAAFPQADLSCVYLKSWNARGGIDSVRYVPDVATQQPNEEPYDLRGEIEDIKATLARLEQNMNQRKQFNNYKQSKQFNRPVQTDEKKEEIE